MHNKRYISGQCYKDHLIISFSYFQLYALRSHDDMRYMEVVGVLLCGLILHCIVIESDCHDGCCIDCNEFKPKQIVNNKKQEYLNKYDGSTQRVFT